nr:Os02g0627750 [Ipomoea trifida]
MTASLMHLIILNWLVVNSPRAMEQRIIPELDRAWRANPEPGGREFISAWRRLFAVLPPSLSPSSSIALSSAALFRFLYRRQAAWTKVAAHILHCCLLCSLLNCAATNFKSSATRANASTSETAFTVRVEDGRVTLGRGSSAHVSSSSPQKSPGPMPHELKNPVRPPFVV